MFWDDGIAGVCDGSDECDLWIGSIDRSIRIKSVHPDMTRSLRGMGCPEVGARWSGGAHLTVASVETS